VWPGDRTRTGPVPDAHAEQRPDLAGIGSSPQERAVEMAEAHRDGGDTVIFALPPKELTVRE
jgi:hypothetical protein